MSKKKNLKTYKVVPSWDKDGTDAETVQASTPYEAVRKGAVKFDMDPEDNFEVFETVSCGKFSATPNYNVKKLPNSKT